MRFAAIQMNSTEDKTKNLSKAENMIVKAAEQGADVIALPELFNFLGPDRETPKEAEPEKGKTVTCMKELAKRLGVYIVGGSILEKRSANSRYFNTCFVFDKRGRVIAKYSKMHLFDIDIQGEVSNKESDFIEPGNEVVNIGTEYGNWGLSICYDLRFPELYRRLALNGANIIFVPAAFANHTGKDQWEPLLVSRAIENEVYVIAPAQVGYHQGKKCNGRSLIVDPWGQVISKASDREMIITAEIDFSFQDRIRRDLPCLTHVREDVFGL